ncbi:MAG: hypothetical protein IPP71_12125 [Bacteroidetes bacterium]|nr:hypothetical protein [Bacteroidota bacterium]
MAPDKVKYTFNLKELFILTMALMLLTTALAVAGEPDFVLPVKPKNVVFGIGIGYGIANNPCRDCNDSKALSGIVLSGSLGYKISKRFKIDFGPTVWIESKDDYNSKGSASNKSANKRMMITFNGYYSPIKNLPLSTKIGAGIGTLIYSRENPRVTVDNKTTNNTEFMNGFALTASVLYSIQVVHNLKIHPSLSVWYTDLAAPSPAYNSYIDPAKPSITSDLRVNFLFDF